MNIEKKNYFFKFQINNSSFTYELKLILIFHFHILIEIQVTLNFHHLCVHRYFLDVLDFQQPRYKIQIV